MLGVGGATYGHTTPPVSSGRRLKESAPPGTDMYAPSEPAAGLYKRPQLQPGRPSPAPRFAAWAAVAGVLASGTGVLALPAPPPQAQSQAVEQEKVKGKLDEELARSYEAIKDVKWSESPRCIDSSAECRKAFDSLPEAAQREYLEMPPAVKTLVARQLTGKTTVIPLVLRVDHRKSFVKGSAFGKNVFDFVQGRIDGKLAKGEIKPEHGPRIRRFLDVCRGLTEAQRSSFVDLLVTDARALK